MRDTSDKEGFLKSDQRALLRFLTCGSVDDGKSTLIGRLLFEAGGVSDDELDALRKESSRLGRSGDNPDFSLLLDGLDAERQQGITIDVAYRYFSTRNRSFIVADTPGHEQYTRNMATGASTSALSVILVDARKGLLTQTKRHSYISSLLGIRSVVLAINKFDLVEFEASVFNRLTEDYAKFASDLGFVSVQAIPLSALQGDNVAKRSARMPWYTGPTLLEYLEQVDVSDNSDEEAVFRFAVQWVNRTTDLRGYAGFVSSGRIAVDAPVVIPRSGQESRVSRIITYDGDQPSAKAGDSVLLTLADEIDVGRGDIIAVPSSPPDVSDQISANLLWMSDHPLIVGRQYLIRVGTQSSLVSISALKYRTDPNTQQHLSAKTLALNEIGVVNISAQVPLIFDPFEKTKATGCFILIDRESNDTVAAGMILFALRRSQNLSKQFLTIRKEQRSAIKNQAPVVLWFTGLSGAGKSTIANIVDERLHQAGYHTMLLDGDNVRMGLGRDLGFTEEDRAENVRRVGEVAKLMVEGGLIVLCALISPYQSERRMVREMLKPEEFCEVFVDTPVDECIRRDPKGLYAKAAAGALTNFTGVDAPYERPENPEFRLVTTGRKPIDVAAELLDKLRDRFPNIAML